MGRSPQSWQVLQPRGFVGAGLPALVLLILALGACDPGTRCEPIEGVSPPPGIEVCSLAAQNFPLQSTDAGEIPIDADTDLVFGDAGTAPTPDRYPDGPFGVAEGHTIANRSFKDSTGELWSFGGVRQDPQARLLLLSTAAGWCTACLEEQPILAGLYNEYRARGLRAAVAVFEDRQGRPATLDYTAGWKAQYALPFPTLVDDRNQFAAFYDTTMAPLVLVVSLPDMKILSHSIGFDERRVRNLIESTLPESPR